MLIQNKQVAIVGGGPGGLTLARLLQQQGATVKVYERDANQNARVQGSPLDLHQESGLAAIRKANLLAEFQANFLPGADQMSIANEHGELLFSDHETQTEENFDSDHFRPEIDRGALRKILLASLQPQTVVWDSHFISMEKQNEGWMLHFENKISVYADLVIAADGARSKIRPYLTNIKPFYTGITMLEGTIYSPKIATPTIYKWLKGGKIMAFGNTKNILMGTKGNGEIGFYASFKANEDWMTTNKLDYTNATQVLEWFKTTYPEWNPAWHELFENATTPFIPRPIYCMPLDQTWNASPNLTLLGDAAHVMPPFAGEGANMAMLDALELSSNLTSNTYNTALEAIVAYEINMRKRAAIAAQESLENGEHMHSKEALKKMLTLFSRV